MAVGDLEGKIGEVNGQLRLLTPILDNLGTKVSGIAEKMAAQQENLKQVWHEITALKKAQDGGGKKVWQVVLALISAVIGGVVTWGITRLTKGGP